jgi:hypothetical protein
MIVMVCHNRVLAWNGASWRARKGGAGNTTDRWQDKEARGALGVGCVFSRGYGAKSNRVCHKRGLRLRRSFNKFNAFARCAEHML